MNDLHIPINWFDVVLVVVLFLGVQSGRKHGLSEELIGTIKWLTIAVGGALVYDEVAGIISNGTVFSLFAGRLMAYVGIALIIAFGFVYLKKALGGKLVGSDIFGRSEFYLGMVAGTVRVSCILIAALALLNARAYSSKEVDDAHRQQLQDYGSNFFPTLFEVQSSVFQKSLTGPFIKNQLGFLLIKPTTPESKRFEQREFAAP